MAIWMVRAGARGERQDYALENDVVVAGWEEMPDLRAFKTREELREAILRVYPDIKRQKAFNWTAQLWAFLARIEAGDLAVLPLKGLDSIAAGQVTGAYRYEKAAPPQAQHQRPVRWIRKDIPRSRFDQDLLFSMGSSLTVCQITRNDAEVRIRAIVEGRKGPSPAGAPEEIVEASDAAAAAVPQDVEAWAKEQIRALIARRFAGHRLGQLVSELLRAEGYHTRVSQPGPDGGVDIVAGKGPLGFDPPKLCVQVKSGDTQQDVKVVRELKGSMNDVSAEHGLFVSWGGFKESVVKELSRDFFSMRLWHAGDLIDRVLLHYELLSDETKADLPLKRIWAPQLPEDD